MDNFIIGILWLGLMAFCCWGFTVAANTGDIIVCVVIGLISGLKSVNFFNNMRRR